MMFQSTLIVLLLHLATFSRCQYPLTTDQSRIALAEFKELAKNDLSQEYMMEDAYLARWLSKGNFNVTDYLLLLREYLTWREEQKMDTILEEDWSDMRTLFSYSRDTFDKSGQPILYYDWGNWDLAGFLEGGQSAYDRLVRYLHMIKEDTAAHIRQLRAEGSNVQKFRYIINAGNLTPNKHYCQFCLKFPTDIANRNTKKYISVAEHEPLVIINVPNSFKKIYSLLPESSLEHIMLYGQDRTQWEEKLMEFINLDQFPAGIFNEPEEKDNSEGLLNVKWKEEL